MTTACFKHNPASDPTNARPHIHVLHPGGSLQCSTYCVVGSTGVVVIDPGSGIHEEEIVESLARVTDGAPKVLAVLLTHPHVDHALGADRFCRRVRAPLMASELAAEWLERGDARIWSEHPEMIRPMRVDRRLADGAVLDVCGFSLLCLNTPGHTDSCMSFLVETDRGRAAFTGDVLMTDPRRLGWAGAPDFSVPRIVESVEKLLNRNLAVAHTGHGSVPGEAAAWLRRGLEHGRRGEWQYSSRSGAPDVPEALMRLYERAGWLEPTPTLACAAGV